MDLLAGLTTRYTYYDDNTTATSSNGANDPSVTWLPGVFVQDEMGVNEFHKVLLGFRYDYNSNHGSIWTPRIAYKWSPNRKNILRFNAGTGYRVVNLFTEDHAALTGARDVIIQSDLMPETSYSANINYVRRLYIGRSTIIGLDATTWYTHFTNQILPDYDTDPNKIIYDNLDGYSRSTGFTLNTEVDFTWGLRGSIGGTFIDVEVASENEEGDLERWQPILTERWTGTWSLTYSIERIRTSIDYTGNLYGPMRLPTLGPSDPRPEYSPWWSIQNVQVTHRSKNERWEFYGGVKNLLDYTPPANSIARAFDPFDRGVQFDDQGNAVASPGNPNALTFDPSYVYAPNQGRRLFAGIRWRLW